MDVMPVPPVIELSILSFTSLDDWRTMRLPLVGFRPIKTSVFPLSVAPKRLFEISSKCAKALGAPGELKPFVSETYIHKLVEYCPPSRMPVRFVTETACPDPGRVDTLTFAFDIDGVPARIGTFALAIVDPYRKSYR